MRRVAAFALALVAGCSASAPAQVGSSSSPAPRTLSSGGPVAARTVLVWSFAGYDRATVRRILSAAPDGGTNVHLGSLPVRSGHRAYPEIPVETIGVHPRQFATAMGAPGLVRSLRHGRAVVSRTSARLRSVAVGDHIRLTGARQLRVGAVVPDAVIGGYEVALRAPRAHDFGISGTAYVLLPHVEHVRPLRRDIERILGDTPVRVRRAGVRPYLRRGDDVAPQATIKRHFGEFALVRHGSAISLRSHWVHRHIESAHVPILGTVTCNRALIPDLRATMRELRREGLSDLVDPSAYGGCYSARSVRGRAVLLSRHTWGAAIDLNTSTNALGTHGHQDPRLVAAFAHHHFTWGGHWLTRPDPQHFEWVGNVAAYTRLR